MTIRVVIAEDEAIIRLDLRATLVEEGYVVVGETGNGEQGGELGRGRLPDRARLVGQMAGRDGGGVGRVGLTGAGCHPR